MTKPAPDLRVKQLKSLIDEYWSLAYAEGREGRTYDNADGAAQRTINAINEAIDALATQPQAPQGAVTPGFRLLPTEPTEAMLLAGGQSIIEGQESRPSTSWAEEAGMSYKAMISAAPETPEGQK